MAAQGVGACTYPSGHVDTLETVVRRAMVTGINQTAIDISLHNARQMNCRFMELSAHSGARTGDGGPDYTNHSWWQGQIVSLELAERFAQAVTADINPRDSWRAAKDFRLHIAVESAKRAFIESVKLAGGEL